MKKSLTRFKKENDKQLLYERLTEGARFREQYRLVFAATIVATFYVAPSGGILEIFLKFVLGIAMVFAALYLICTAASVKYMDTRIVYQVFYVSERVRMRTFDWAVDSFAAGLLLLLSLFAAGSVQKAFDIHFNNTLTLGMVVVLMLILGGLIGLVGLWSKRIDANSSEDVNKLI